MTAPNIVGVTTIIGKTAVAALTTSSADLVVNSASSGKVYKINSLLVANIDGTNSADVTIAVVRSATSYYLASTITVPADATLVVISKETNLYLEEGDTITGRASATGDLQVVCSYEEIS